MSDKSVLIKNLESRKKKYDVLLERLSHTAKEKYGEDIMYNYSIPSNFNINTLDEKEIIARTQQEISVPYNNKVFKEMISMPKRVVKNIFIKNNKGKNVQGMFLIGKNSKKDFALFSLTIVRDIKNPQDYSIKLDVKPQNKFWMPLVRIDCGMGMRHPNYLVKGNVVENNDMIVRVPTPHIHINNQLTQVLFYDNLEYSLAKPLEYVINKKTPYQTKNTLINLIDYVLKYANIKVRFMENINPAQYGNTLFNFEDVCCADEPIKLSI